MLGVTSAASSLPVIFFSLPAGVIVDRYSKRRLMLITQSIALVQSAVLAGLTLSGVVTVWEIIALAAVLGASNALDAPARQAYTIEMVGRDDLLNAIALNSTMFNLARTLGPALAGIIVAGFGEGAAFTLNAISYALVIYFLLKMSAPLVVPSQGTQPKGELRESFNYLRGNAQIRTYLWLASGINFFGFAFSPLLPLISRDLFHADVKGLGFLAASSGLGALSAALMLAYLSTRLKRSRLHSTSAILFPVFVMALAICPNIHMAMVAIFFAGWAGVTTLVLTNSGIQTIVPDELRGRVMSIFTLCVLGLSPVGGLLAGYFIQAGAPLVTVIMVFAICSLVVSIACASRLRASENK